MRHEPSLSLRAAGPSAAELSSGLSIQAPRWCRPGNVVIHVKLVKDRSPGTGVQGTSGGRECSHRLCASTPDLVCYFINKLSNPPADLGYETNEGCCMPCEASLAGVVMTWSSSPPFSNREGLAAITCSRTLAIMHGMSTRGPTSEHQGTGSTPL